MHGSVVVTGASTGIGAATARALAGHGFHVFGTVRRHQDGTALEEAGVVPVLMDVTDTKSIERAHAAVVAQLATRPLTGLINNAGIPVAGPLEHVPLDELRRVLEVNIVGVVAVTQAFLPELRRSRGRIVNMSSVSGRLALPFMGPYAASKFALEAISDSLRRELMPAGVNVIVVAPGSVRTAIWSKVAGIDLTRYAGTAYEHVLPSLLESAIASGDQGLPPEAVADAVVTALTTQRPKARIVVVKHPLTLRIMSLMPVRWIDRAIAKRIWGKHPRLPAR